ncbi:MAG: hypothetical protein MJE68_25400, partial [Proteobacteria bacterium]|nr:hypothetical protein [Pseudomonadota bacterium]
RLTLGLKLFGIPYRHVVERCTTHCSLRKASWMMMGNSAVHRFFKKSISIIMMMMKVVTVS